MADFKVQPNDFAGAATSVGGAAAGASSGAAAASTGFLGISPLGWGLIGVSLIGSFLLRGKRKGPAPEAQGIRLQQPVDANAPWLCVYGEPWYAPPLLTSYFVPGTMNALSITRKNTAVRMHHLSGGPISGANLNLRIANRQLFTEVTTDDPAEQRTLTVKAGSNGKVFLFPASDVVVESIALYVADVLVWTGANGSVTTGDTEDVGPSSCAAASFTKNGASFLSSSYRDSTIGSAFTTRVGCILPKFGDIDERSVKATIFFDQARSYRLPGSDRTGFASSVALTHDDFSLGTTDDKDGAKQYLWVNLKVNDRLDSQLVPQKVVKSFTVSYTMKIASVVVEVTVAADGSAEVFFSKAPSGAVTATYKTASEPGEGFRYHMTRGENTQAAFSAEEDGFFGSRDSASRHTVAVGLELTKGGIRRHSTDGDADDVIIGLESGPRGFYGVSDDGSQGGLRRTLTMRFKESAAADAKSTKLNDPSTGWVNLNSPAGGGAQFSVWGLFTGTGQWFFSLADLFAYTRDGKLDANSKNWLPPKPYDVEIIATDAAGVNDAGIVDTDRRFSQLFFQTATELRRIGLVLPNQATLAAEYGDGMDQTDLLEVKYAGRVVVQPSSSSATVDDGGLPTPRTTGYSRNPVWCVCDFLTDPIVGAGRHFAWSDIDIASAYAAAAWCDETVTLSDGTTQVRSLLDIALGEGGERRSIGEQIAHMLAGQGVFAYWSGQWKFAVDEDATVPTDPTTSAAFTVTEEADCIPGGCEMEYVGVEERPTELVVHFRDNENGDAPATEPVRVPDPQPTPRVSERVEFPGVRRRTQAAYFGAILLRQLRGARRRGACVGTIGRGLRLLLLEPGDVIYFTSARLGVSAMKVRVMSVGWTSGMRPAFEWVEHVSTAYSEGFRGPNSGVTPGLRKPVENLPAPTVKAQRVTSGTYTFSVGGAK